jgi:toxin CptA
MPVQRIAIKRSLWLAVALSAIHLGAAVATWLAAVPLWLQTVITLAIAVNLVYYVSRHAVLRTSQAIVSLEVTDDGRIAFQTHGGNWHECRLLGSSYVSPSLTILNLEVSVTRRVRHVVLISDNIEPGEFRRLRTWLRWAAQPDARHGSGST